jgi:TonB family protein
MNARYPVLATVLLGGLLSVPAFATTTAAHFQTNAALALELPVPAKIVSPIDLPRTFQRVTVMVSLVIDETGQPRDIRIVSARDRALTRSLVSAIAQWQFTPARRNGAPVSVKAILPLEVIEA